MGLGGIRQRICVLDAQLEFAGGDPAKNISRTLFEFLASGDVMRQSRTCDEQRALLRELDEIEGRYRSAGSAEENEVAAGTKYVEVLLECVLPTPS